jgi:hypothetical protein
MITQNVLDCKKMGKTRIKIIFPPSVGVDKSLKHVGGVICSDPDWVRIHKHIIYPWESL